MRLMNRMTIDLDEPTEEDLESVKELITEFVNETDSTIGRNILEDWGNSVEKLIKIFPKDYKRALQELEVEKKAVEQNKENGAVVNGSDKTHLQVRYKKL